MTEGQNEEKRYQTQGVNKQCKEAGFGVSARVFIVDDHPVFRAGMVRLVNEEPGLTVCGEADSAEAAFGLIKRCKPDLMLVDISLPGRSGLQLIKDVRATKSSVRMLVVSMHDEALYADRALRAGADGYIMKQETPEEIIRAIFDAPAGHLYVSEEVFEIPAKRKPGKPPPGYARPLRKLADIELEIVESLARGRSKHEIAEQLKVSPHQLATRISEIQKKIDLKSVTAMRSAVVR